MSTGSAQAVNEDPQRDDVLVEVSATMIGLYQDLFGLGPARARSHWAGPDALVCIVTAAPTPKSTAKAWRCSCFTRRAMTAHRGSSAPRRRAKREVRPPIVGGHAAGRLALRLAAAPFSRG